MTIEKSSQVERAKSELQIAQEEVDSLRSDLGQIQDKLEKAERYVENLQFHLDRLRSEGTASPSSNGIGFGSSQAAITERVRFALELLKEHGGRITQLQLLKALQGKYGQSLTRAKMLTVVKHAGLQSEKVGRESFLGLRQQDQSGGD
jgi:chromosome segregation ATPase